MYPISFSPFPELETERLLLRRMTLDDAEAMFALRSSERVAKYIDRPLARNIEDAHSFINSINEGITIDKWVFWAICLRENPTLLGTICLWNFAYKPLRADVGYELLPKFQGQGIMREALQKVIAYGFDTLHLHMAEAYTHAHNDGSVKLLERAGFIRERIFQEEHSSRKRMIDMVVYALKNYEK